MSSAGAAPVPPHLPLHHTPLPVLSSAEAAREWAGEARAWACGYRKLQREDVPDTSIVYRSVCVFLLCVASGERAWVPVWVLREVWGGDGGMRSSAMSVLLRGGGAEEWLEEQSEEAWEGLEALAGMRVRDEGELLSTVEMAACVGTGVCFLRPNALLEDSIDPRGDPEPSMTREELERRQEAFTRPLTAATVKWCEYEEDLMAVCSSLVFASANTLKRVTV